MKYNARNCIVKEISINRRRKCANAGALLALAELSVGNTKEAWTIIQSWYSHTSGQPLAQSQEDLEKVTDDLISLYTKEAPPDPIFKLIAPFDISDGIPDKNEIAEAVKQLRNWKAPSPSKIII